jgi:hypothetical protein
MFIFTNRVYWWIQFRHYCKRDETVLMTRGLGLGTAAMPAAMLCLLLALIIPVGPWSPVPAVMAIVGWAWFTRAYGGFWRLCARRRGIGFAVAAALSSVFFSFAITASAAAGYLTIAWSAMRRRELPFVTALLSQA